MRFQLLLSFFLPLTFAPSASAQVFALPPFQGAQHESFETQVSDGMIGWQTCLVGDAFDETVEICTPLGSHLQVVTNWSYDCDALPVAGEYLAGARDGSYVMFTLLIPADRIGGYFTVNAPELGTVTAYFYDQVYQPLGQHQLEISADCNWTWNGWESQGGPIYFIEIVHSLYGGGRVLFDELTLDFADDTVGTRFCDALPNSTGQPARMTASGTTSIGAANLALSTSPVPASAPAIVFYGPEAVSVPFGLATRCVGAAPAQGMQRLVTAPASLAGEIQLDIDYTHPDLARVVAGTTWYFQTWFADSGSSFGSGLSDALELVFVP